MTLVNTVLEKWFSHPISLSLAILVLSLFLYEIFRPKLCFEVYHKSPPLPLIGTRPGEYFTRWRAIWRNALDIKTATVEAYKYKDKACILPIIDIGDVVLIHPSEAQWLQEVPESEMSTHQQQLNTFQLLYTIADPKLVMEEMPVHEVLIGGNLTRETNSLLPDMTREGAKQIDANLGVEAGKTTSVKLMDSLPTVISRAANCAFVGVEMCNKPGLVDSAMKFAKGVGLTSVVLRCSPQILRPLISFLTTGPQKRAAKKFYKELGPEVRRRMGEVIRQTKSGVPKEKSKNNDFLQWLIEAAVDSRNAYMMNPETIMGRILLVNFVSIHISSMVLTSVLLDLASSDPTHIEQLREEIVAALQKYEAPQFYCVITPSGVHLPYGTTAAVLSYPILNDPELYDDVEKFKPFRFSDKRATAGESLEEKMRQNWISVTSSYTAFGTGKHACPGRFFASNMLKITLSYILLNYDFVPLKERPNNIMFSVSILPSPSAAVEFKRREVPLFRWEDIDLDF